ncbi:MAG: VWA domain-containing protein, partial [Bacteroidetes bacterium]
LSTFSIDVDRASYANVRRFLMSSQLPPKDAVRTEELINYFDYDYPQKEGAHPFSVHTELSACPWNPERQLLMVALQAPEINLDEAPPSNIVFLIDVSGSMESSDKLPLLKDGLEMMVRHLRPEDRVSIVVYAGAAGLVLPSTPGDKTAKILEAIENLNAGGSTAGGAGIELAYKVVIDNFMKKGNNRVILATDGDFNVGVSSESELVRLIEEKRESGVFLSVLGFGIGNYQDGNMEQLADKGNGNYAYIDNLLEARKVLVSEMGGTLYAVAKDVKLQLEFNPATVKAYRLVGYENRLLEKEDFNNDAKDAGEMGAGHTVTAFYEIIPANSSEQFTARVDPLRYQSAPDAPAALSRDLLTVKVRYKQPEGIKSVLIEQAVSSVPLPLAQTTENYRFASAVAEWGLLLRDSPFKAKASYESLILRAKAAKGSDEEGYRAEFIRLAELSMELSD